MWILTEGYDDYDQHGKYFVKAWLNKPTLEQIMKLDISEIVALHILKGGGRIENDYQWYSLEEVDDE